MKKLLLIDANSLIHRAFHALPSLTSKKSEPIGAIYGIVNMLLKIIHDHNPSHITAAFDRPEPTFRKEIFKEYKATRPKAPEELISQIVRAHEVFEKLHIPFFEVAGFEADDIIGTLVQKFKEKVSVVIILTGDRDALQLVESNHVVVETPKKGLSDAVVYTAEEVKTVYGIEPRQIIDFKGLSGDVSDNIPGVPGVGPKTALKILEKYETLENAYSRMNRNDPMEKKLLLYRNQAFLSKRLATIRKDVPVSVELKDIEYHSPSREEIVAYLTDLGFESIVKRITRETRETKPIQDRLL